MPSGCLSFASRYCFMTGVAGGVTPPLPGPPRTQAEGREFVGFGRANGGAQQLTRGGLQDAHVDDVAGRDSSAPQHDGPLALADPTVWPVQLVAPLDQDLDVASDPALRLARRDAALQGEQVVQAAQLLLARHVILHSRRG